MMPRTLARRRWPLILAALVVVAVVWVLSRREVPPVNQPNEPDPVERPVVEIKLDSISERLAGIEVSTVTAAGSGALFANGTITYDGNHVSVVASRAEGRIVSVRTDLGRRVGRGDVLAIVESPEIGVTRGAWQRARAAVEIAQKNYEREKRLYDQLISPQKDLLAAEGEYRTAQAELGASLAKLTALGAEPEGEGGRFGLASPVAGIVVERHATPGQIVGPSVDLLTVADLRHVWITVDVYETDYGRIRNGAMAQIMPAAVPDTFAGRVTYAGGIVDSVSRTMKVRVEVENESRRLRPGMFARVRIETPTASGDSTLVIPEAAVQNLEGTQVVFVPGGSPGRYVARPVTLGPSAGADRVVVASGLDFGDRVVTEGAFQLKAELTKSSFGEEE
ncbi:MAG: efflux RND transporter periplasmic adaptor subunit [Gemmatimonadales bacterium]